MQKNRTLKHFIIHSNRNESKYEKLNIFLTSLLGVVKNGDSGFNLAKFYCTL